VKRYYIDKDSLRPGEDIFEHPNGEWVKWEDVKKEIEESIDCLTKLGWIDIEDSKNVLEMMIERLEAK
jgi:hypothetical protein